jgi:hypothetical protein
MRRTSALAVVICCGIGLVSVAHAGTIKEVVIFGRGGAAGTVQMGDADGLDVRITPTKADNNRNLFELWWVNGSYFGLRFVGPDIERWVGICPFNFGRNSTVAKQEVLDKGFLWVSSFYRSEDDGIGRVGDDDDKDGRRDRVTFTYDVLKDVLVGEHSENATIVQTASWNTVGNDAFPDIPGDLTITNDGPIQLLNDLKSGGALDPQGGDEDDAVRFLSELQTFVPEPPSVVLLGAGASLSLLVRGGRRTRSKASPPRPTDPRRAEADARMMQGFTRLVRHGRIGRRCGAILTRRDT